MLKVYNMAKNDTTIYLVIASAVAFYLYQQAQEKKVITAIATGTANA